MENDDHSPTQRIVQLTFHKCGSQWVRDVLTAPAIQTYSGMKTVGSSPNLMGEPWPDQPEGTFLGPIYNASPADWAAHRHPGDRAIVILRDPRDRLVSWMFSAAFSHVLEPSVRFWRELLLPMNNRCRILLSMIELGGVAPLLEQWAAEADSDQTLITTYEKLVREEGVEFRRIVDFLGWPIPPEILEETVQTFNFANRSGRSKGEENVFSHYRKGISGDWRRYFNRETGFLWEQRMPGLLQKMGYETSSEWYLDLPEIAEVAENETGNGQAVDFQVTDVQAKLVKTLEANQEASAIYQRELIAMHREKSERFKVRRRHLQKRIRRLVRLLTKLKNKRVVRFLRQAAKKRRSLFGSSRKVA